MAGGTAFYCVPIKPPALKVDAVRLEILNALTKEGRFQQNELRKTTAGWKGSKPTFQHQVSIAGGDAMLIVGPGGDANGAQKWIWLNDGTKRHWVAPRRAKSLRFQAFYRAGTTPRKFTSTAGQSSGPFVFSKGHWVSGIAAREWILVLYEQRHIPFRQALNEALSRGMAKAMVKT